MGKSNDVRINVITAINKGRLDGMALHFTLKYQMTAEQREYILNKINPKYNEIVYCSPFPTSHEEVSQHRAAEAEKFSLITEIEWYFELLLKYPAAINKFLIINDKLEKSILLNDYDTSINLLNEMDNDICHSFYSLICEFYINETTDNSEENKQIISELIANDSDQKFLILSEFNRMRMDNKLSTLQYEAILEQHKQLYKEPAETYIDYVNFKMNPLNYEETIGNLSFVAYMDSDFSIIDRYITLKNLLVLYTLDQEIVETEKSSILNSCQKLANQISDPFWKNFLQLNNIPCDFKSERVILYYQIQDLFFNAEYENVIQQCGEIFESHPNYSELYIFLTQSILILNWNIEDVFKTKNDLQDILKLLRSVLEKNSKYTSDREKLLKKYCSLSHFELSNPILEFIVNEYHLNVNKKVQNSTYLLTHPVRYNFYKEITPFRDRFEILNNLRNYDTFNFIYKQLDLNDTSNAITETSTFFNAKVGIGILINEGKYNDALLRINNFQNGFKNTSIPAFIDTWLTKTSIKCLTKTKQLDKAAGLIVEYFFKNSVAYDHFYDGQLFENLSNSEDFQITGDISIPILFQIYNQPQSAIYDTIANFLISNSAFKPSDLLNNDHNFDQSKFNYLLEKCFIKENIEDSPFLNTIEELDEERIKILNYLKEVNPSKNEKYNEEILKIKKESSIRKGLLQIQESRIYVDVQSISKLIEIELSDIFEQYLNFDDLKYAEIYSLKLNDALENNIPKTTYYFKKPLEPTFFEIYELIADVETDPNAVIVPYIRFQYFHSLFEGIKNHFVYDEDYGFKSFLSMRIRHGTFSNVLRSVFDKYNLISSKEADLQSYGEIKHWNSKVSNYYQTNKLQSIFKKFSEDVDSLIDTGLSWVKVKSIEADKIIGMFNFDFSPQSLSYLYINRVGRIDNLTEFATEIFNILFERLEQNLNQLRTRITNELTPSFVTLLDDLQKNTDAIGLDQNEHLLIDQEIVSCRTEIQVVTTQMINWFKISKNQYIEEFQIEMILQTSLDYINTINRNAISNATVNVENKCSLRFKGKYFESFGDIFINIFDNIISKNRDIEDLVIEISIHDENNYLNINVKNNLPIDTDINILSTNVQSTIAKIESYKNGSTVSFEKGSGYLKLCKSIAVDLNRSQYIIIPKCTEQHFEVSISFSLYGLI